MKAETPVEFINRLANEMRESEAISIEGTIYTESQFPAGFWRKLVKEVNYLAHIKSNLGEGQMKHPMQPIQFDAHGVIRFKPNKIVQYMLDAGGSGKKFDLNSLTIMGFSDEDFEQLAQLIGYSVSGFGSLSYASQETVDAADEIAEQLSKSKQTVMTDAVTGCTAYLRDSGRITVYLPSGILDTNLHPTESLQHYAKEKKFSVCSIVAELAG